MELHNTMEDLIIARVGDIFDTITKEGNPANYCTCTQCRIDTACYVLNRTQPHYIISNRGVARVQQETHENQQKLADITTLVYEGPSGSTTISGPTSPTQAWAPPARKHGASPSLTSPR
jgi:competence protein ComFB